MEAAQKKSVRTLLPVTDTLMQGINFRSILASGEYLDDTRECQKLTPAYQTWDKRKTKFLLSYAAKDLSDTARDAVGQPFGGQAIAHALPQQVQPQVTNQMVNTLAGYLDNITSTDTTIGRGTKLAHLDASMDILVDTNAAQAKEFKQMREQINDLRNSNNNPQADTSGPTRTVCPHCTAFGRSVPHTKYACYFNPKNIKNITTLAKELTKEMGVTFDAGK